MKKAFTLLQIEKITGKHKKTYEILALLNIFLLIYIVYFDHN